jgi:cobalt-zinc-cadmium resistance protein CzcA
LYGLSDPFSGFSVSVGLPIFGGSSYRNKIKAAEIQRNYQQSLYDYERLSLTTAYSQAYQQLLKDEELLRYYEGTGLAQAEAIMKAANIAYRAGEIGFAELSQFLTQSIDIQKNYLDVLNQYNQSAIQLNYFLNK